MAFASHAPGDATSGDPTRPGRQGGRSIPVRNFRRRLAMFHERSHDRQCRTSRPLCRSEGEEMSRLKFSNRRQHCLSSSRRTAEHPPVAAPSGPARLPHVGSRRDDRHQSSQFSLARQRNRFAVRLGFIVAVAALSTPCGLLANSGRPNVLWLVSEDHGPHLGCYGDSVATTPNVDALAKIGLRYNRCWSNAPVCAPARTTLIAGLYAPSSGGDQMRSMVPYPQRQQMFPQILR